MSDSPSSLHLRALKAAREFKSAEAELVEVIRLIDEKKVFLERGHPSLFQYVVSELGLSESTTYAFITVARKSREVPELARKIQEGSLSVSQARKIVPVLTPQNPGEWLTKATQMSQRRLEKEVASVRPETKTPEKASYVSGSRIKLELGIPEKDMLRLRRAQDLLCQNRKRAVSLEETLIALTEEFLDRNDPVEKAKRHQATRGSQPARESAPKPTKILKTLESIPVRTPIPAAIKHQVHLRDQGRCTHRGPAGERCAERRWLEIHHLRPVSQGGTHALANLATLCSAHHRHTHQAPAPSVARS